MKRDSNHSIEIGPDVLDRDRPSKPALASLLQEILLEPWTDGPIARIEAGVDKVMAEHAERERDREVRRAYREQIGACGRSAVQFSDPAGG